MNREMIQLRRDRIWRGYQGSLRFKWRYAVCELPTGGDIVAVGQLDHCGKNTQHAFYIVQASGKLLEVDRVAAFEHWEGQSQ